MVTGHRPDKLFGYDMSDSRYEKIKEFFKQVLVLSGCTEAISGMALGSDTIFANAVLELKEEGYPIKLVCAIPCRGFTSKWPKESVEEYAKIVKKADFVKLVVDDAYAPAHMQARNKWMVDRIAKDSSGLGVAIWSGEPGGTANCIKYLKKKNVSVLVVNPEEFKGK